MPRLSVCLVSLVLLALSGAARAGERVYQFQTQEDPQGAAAAPNACKASPFQATAALAGIISVQEKGSADGRVQTGAGKHLGSALACLRITDRTFAEGSQAEMYASFELPEGHFAAVGRCTVSSNAVPRQGVVLASCALKLTQFPAGYAGGSATSASLFNPLHLPGYDTGSLWTLRVFESEPAASKGPTPPQGAHPPTPGR